MMATMKKLLFAVAVATPLLFACEVEMVPVEQDENPVALASFTASIEDVASPTKADLSGSNLVWATGDKIGIYVSDYGEYNQAFTLVGDGGSSSGSFVRDQNGGVFESEHAESAYFPWGGGNNVSKDNGHFYITLPEHNGSDAEPTYTSGKLLTPLVAQVTRTGDAYDPIAFKHAGAAVKLTINNLPVGAHSVSLTADQPIYGYFNIDPTNVGSGMVENSAGVNDGKTTTWLHFAPPVSATPFTFIFPVPALSTPTLTFSIYDKNDVCVWSRKASSQSSVGRAEILAMPALTITPYKEFDQISSWGVCGTHNSWAGDTPMVTEVDGNIHIANDITFEANAEFKIRTVGSWTKDFGYSDLASTDGLGNGDGNNIKILAAGTYDIIFDSTTDNEKIKVVASEIDYPDAGTMPHHSSIKNAKNLGATETANCYVITDPGKYAIPVVKGNSSTSAGTVGGVELLWETYNNTTSVTPNSVIEAVDWDETLNYIFFKTPDVLQPGNALIAAKDDSDNIIWSWHIWIPASTITDIEEYSVSKKYLMDRNLGAIVPAEVPVGDGTVDLRSVGLYYQWGRKDPFVGYKFGKVEVEPSISGASGRNMLKSTTKVTVDESIAIPTTFIKGTDTKLDGDWLSSTDNTLWGQGSSKTIYDPCPAGYRVPNYDSSDNLWKQVTGLDNFSSSTASAGHWWKLGSAVFPYSGCYDYNASISHPYDRCWVWSAKANGTADYGEAQYVYDNSGTWASQPGWGKRKSCGAVVRCVRIEGEILPPIPAGAKGVTLATDGTISTDWSKAEAISDTSDGIKEWKYGYDSDNLYFYFKIRRGAIKALDAEPYSYRTRRYIYFALDTDNDSSSGVKPSSGDYKESCFEVLGLVYPFDGNALTSGGTDGTLNIINGLDDLSYTKIIAPESAKKTTDDDVYAYGNVQADYVYVEISVPRADMGISPSFTGIMKVQFSLSSTLTSLARIELE